MSVILWDGDLYILWVLISFVHANSVTVFGFHRFVSREQWCGGGVHRFVCFIFRILCEFNESFVLTGAHTMMSKSQFERQFIICFYFERNLFCKFLFPLLSCMEVRQPMIYDLGNAKIFVGVHFLWSGTFHFSAFDAFEIIIRTRPMQLVSCEIIWKLSLVRRQTKNSKLNARQFGTRTKKNCDSFVCLYVIVVADVDS